MCTLMPVSGIRKSPGIRKSAVRNALPLPITRTDLPSWAAIAATENTEAVDAVGDYRLAWSSLSCLSPPATSIALILSNIPETMYLSFRNIEERLSALLSRTVRSKV